MSILNRRWKLVLVEQRESIDRYMEDDSIFTIDNEEVLGCSEWLRCDRETLQHIVDLHNAEIDRKTA